MAYKDYFLKASWTDTTQPLLREHKTAKLTLDLTKDHWEIVERVERELLGSQFQVKDFCIDFLIVAE
jgi:sulfur relay (sulfurtransferase) DsrC/TusE family protein